MKYTYEQLEKELERSMPVPTAFASFDEEQNGDYACWITDEITTLYAGNSKIISEIFIRFELYTRTKDVALEDRVEAVLNAMDLPWEKQAEIWLANEEVFMILYRFSITQGEEYKEAQSE